MASDDATALAEQIAKAMFTPLQEVGSMLAVEIDNLRADLNDLKQHVNDLQDRVLELEG